ncbi:unnamed protein product [Rhizophagus irregularis]|uniref:Uncharacterized protein n=2 Tax=Rhizophagus irregularis TaxID=588596 RepID=A0A915Z6C7_9GLOM|nr:hypothetical protein OCT59_005766 [Rhizophagus irregularis]CAB4396413.1 unnamed protein product [Rhizophagus irregularis]CAB4412573.1 unnamed protein product [Rhizophagus irregularis]CAB4479481.1 unnamed protein product [Rhizophagus irregularis]CAB5185721.1 unnamed protein product [Rhizophagus irregularis]
MTDNTKKLPECEWGYSISDCNYDLILQAFYICSDVLYIIVMIGAIALLMFRIIARKGHIWEKGCFAPLEGYLLGVSIFSMARAFTNIIQQMNWFSNNPILREMIYDFSWFSGDFTIATYLAGIFRTLPRMTFYKFSNENSPTILILKGSQISNIFWTFFCIHIIYSQTLAILTGYGLVHLSFAFAAIYYGKRLVEFTKNSFTLAGVNDDNIGINSIISSSESSFVGSNQSIDANRSIRALTNIRINQNIRKMRILNFSCIYIFLWHSISLIIVSFLHYILFNQPIASKSFFFLTNISIPLSLLIALIGILQAEFYPGSYEFVDFYAMNSL